MRVLVVEDEPHIAEAVTFLLEREGHEVTVVASGPETPEAMGEAVRGYDLLLLDIMLPGRSGFDIARDTTATDGQVPVSARVPEDLDIRDVTLQPSRVGYFIQRAAPTTNAEDEEP